MNNDLISREALKKAIKDEFDLAIHNGDIMLMSKSGIVDRILAYIDNAPTVEPRIEYRTDGQPYRLFMSGGQVVPDTLQGWRYEERPQGDIRWTDKVFVSSSGDIIDFQGRVVGHIDLEVMKGGAK